MSGQRAGACASAGGASSERGCGTAARRAKSGTGGRRTGSSAAGGLRSEESARAEAPTFIVDVDEYGSNRGDSTAFISQSEYVARVAEFERVMRERFLDGLDENFDYARVDNDPAKDAHWRREMDQDVEDAYFDAD